MRIEIRSDSVLLDGYVNAVGRDSKPVITPKGKVVEMIEPKAFQDALDSTDNVDMLLDHDKNRKLGNTKDGSIELYEDNIGLRVIATITDPEVIQDAKNKKLKGWSFAMKVVKDYIEERAEQIPRRHIKKLKLFEVSLIKRLSPVYAGTLIEQRAEEEEITEHRGDEFRAVIVDESTQIDYSEYEARLNKIKANK